MARRPLEDKGHRDGNEQPGGDENSSICCKRRVSTWRSSSSRCSSAMNSCTPVSICPDKSSTRLERTTSIASASGRRARARRSPRGPAQLHNGRAHRGETTDLVGIVGDALLQIVEALLEGPQVELEVSQMPLIAGEQQAALANYGFLHRSQQLAGLRAHLE